MNKSELSHVKRIISKVSYLNWKFFVGNMGDGYYIQLRFKAMDKDHEKIIGQHGRKWYVSKYAIDDEIVRTCFLAVMTASEHEIRENFTYNKKSIFGPHISINSLSGASQNISKRKEIKK